MNILFLGDIFGQTAVLKLKKYLPKLLTKYKVDFTIAQAENVSGRKGLLPIDYECLKKSGVDALTLGNHVWAKPEIMEIINNNDLIRPYNVKQNYAGQGTRLFQIKNKRIRVSQFLGITFNELRKPWKENVATNFFDAFDNLNKNQDHDIHIIDFHAETTSEKNVFALYLDGKIDAILGTHTHVQTNDARILPSGTAFISDVGMVGPINSAIGASFESVYKKMRFNEHSKFQVAKTEIAFNAVLLKIKKNYREIETITKILR